MTLSLDHQKLSLKISVGNGDYALTPLYPLLQNTDEVQVTIRNCAVMEALEYTYQQLLDLAYFIIPAVWKSKSWTMRIIIICKLIF